MKSTIFFLLFFVAVAFWAGGCSSVADDANAKPPLAFAPEDNYRELTDYKLSFAIKKNEFPAGEEGTLIIALRNDGNQLLNIADFRINHIDNIQVFCQIWFPGSDEPDQFGWLPLNPTVQEPEWRYPLKLAPTNEVLFTIPLSFVAQLELARGTEARYFVKCRTNLQTVKVESEVMTIIVHNPEDFAIIEAQKQKNAPQPPPARNNPTGSVFQ